MDTTATRKRAALTAQDALPCSYARFGPDPCAAARLRPGAHAAPDRLRNLRHAQRGQDQRGDGLPRPDRRSVRRRQAPRHRQGRLVGTHGRPGQADRHRALLRDLRQRARRLHGHHGAELARSRNRQALRPLVPRDHRVRHGPRPGHAARPSRNPGPALRDRRLHGRHAGAGMGGEISGPGENRDSDRDRREALRAEHRLPRGRPPGHHGGPGVARRRLRGPELQSEQRPGGRPHGGPRHLSVGSRASFEIRAQPAGPGQSRLRASTRISRSRATCAIRARPSSTGSTPMPISI